MRSKILLLFLIVSVICISIGLTIGANSGEATPTVKVIVNGKQLAFDVDPVIKEGRTLVPLRGIFESLGAEVGWDGATKTVTGEKGDITIKLKINHTTAIVAGKDVSLDVPATIVEGRTMVPARFISESLGATVKWDGNTKTVIIYTEGYSAGELQVHYIDVGQADSILVITPNKKTIMIDTGNNGDSKTIIEYLKNQKIQRIDAIIGTHPHEDHIGSMDTVINNFDIGKVYMPKASTTTKTFEDVLNAVKSKGLKVTTAVGGVNLDLDPDIKAEFFAPNSSSYKDLNDYSAVLKVTYNKTSFLFTGDAEERSEHEMLQKKYNLTANVLKVGHHGSYSSTCDEFLQAVDPQFAVICVGEDNKYGHPDPETLRKLLERDIKVYRTDENGNIIATSNGSTITFSKER